MRIILQRAAEASVLIDNKDREVINKGLVLLVGIENEDTIVDIQWLVRKILNMRIFNDSDNKMNRSLLDIGGEILLISQFTLYASTKKGNRPSFINSAKPDVAIPLYEKLLDAFRSVIGTRLIIGKFGADMKVSLINDGPVTIILDSKNKE